MSQREYIDPDYHFPKGSKLWKDAKKTNDRLQANVKRAKRDYEKAEKLKRLFQEAMS